LDADAFLKVNERAGRVELNVVAVVGAHLAAEGDVSDPVFVERGGKSGGWGWGGVGGLEINKIDFLQGEESGVR
jgi:hypothetical protein